MWYNAIRSFAPDATMYTGHVREKSDCFTRVFYIFLKLVFYKIWVCSFYLEYILFITQLREKIGLFVLADFLSFQMLQSV